MQKRRLLAGDIIITRFGVRRLRIVLHSTMGGLDNTSIVVRSPLGSNKTTFRWIRYDGIYFNPHSKECGEWEEEQ